MSKILDHDFAHSDVRIAAPELAGPPALRVHAAGDAIDITPALGLGLSVFCVSPLKARVLVLHQETADLSAINTGQEILCNLNAHLGPILAACLRDSKAHSEWLADRTISDGIQNPRSIRRTTHPAGTSTFD